jgi:pilus assembly protein CpaE
MSTSIRRREPFLGDSESSLGMSTLSLLVIGPQEERRRNIAKALAGPQANITREMSRYPHLDELSEILEGDYDVAVIDLDPNPELALDVVENLYSRNPQMTVIAYSAHADPDVLVRCMRAGAREFLTEPLLSGTVGEALVRASVRRGEAHRHKIAAGKLLIFVGAKGGAGVTTVASNFAVALARYGKVALIDLDLQLGDAALTLGLNSKFTTLDALENIHRLDSDFLDGLMTRHASGLAVLGAPDVIPAIQPSRGGIERLLHVAREDFSYVVVDAGSHSIDMYESLFDAASAVYLVVQVSVAELRNANRFVSRYFHDLANEKLEIALNRYVARSLEIDEAAITKALTRPATWRIPNDYAAARNAQNTGVPIASGKSQVARVLGQMAAAAAGQVTPAKKKWGLFG